MLSGGVRDDVVSVVDHENAFENVLEGEVFGGGSKRGKWKARGRDLGTPTSDDWNVVAMYVEILRTFYIVTERLSGSLYVTCNTFYKEVTTIKNAMAKMELSDDPKLLMLAKGMHLKFDKYWGMKRVYNLYEKRSIEHDEKNADESRNKEKNAMQVMDLSEALDSEFDQHMEEETNMGDWISMDMQLQNHETTIKGISKLLGSSGAAESYLATTSYQSLYNLESNGELWGLLTWRIAVYLCLISVMF
ncbi:hypothetical protein Vadar_013528 [Vaccinium darrowii]|uniref:Uncharacterized protein n=1 Tax=Vaccinium darrowii TaxID=229202 RepID=A0ACB7YEL9_9ERIC|nr:hypothetical protein Vadar_013528 [Vaccinium darrowii]